VEIWVPMDACLQKGLGHVFTAQMHAFWILPTLIPRPL
jgi:hypothetical protein